MNIKTSKLTTNTVNSQIKIATLCVLSFAILLRILIAVCYYNEVDLINFNLGWMQALQKNFFDGYSNIDNLDYPPVFLFMLYFCGFSSNLLSLDSTTKGIMFVLKFFPVLFDILIILFIFYIIRKKSQNMAFIFAIYWALNPAAIVNSSFWGQTDCILIFFLIISFYLFEKKSPIWATVFYVIAVLTKFQALFFAPVVFFELISSYKIKTILKSTGAGILTFLITFTPFAVANNNFLLPFNLYLDGYGKYNFATLNAFNFYSMIGLNYFKSDQPLISLPLLQFLTVDFLSAVLTLASIGMVVYIYFKARRKNIWVISGLLMQCIFMMTGKMHERYQFLAVIFFLMAFYDLKDLRFFKSYIFISLISAINQTYILLIYNPDGLSYTPLIPMAISFINFILFIYTFYISINYLFYKDKLPLAQNQRQAA